jgi:WD40 repeat protein
MRVMDRTFRQGLAFCAIAALAMGLLAGCGGVASILSGLANKVIYSKIIGGVVKLVAKTIDGGEEVIGGGGDPQTRPYVSTNGFFVVYTVNEGTADQAVWLMNEDGGNPHELIGPGTSPLSGPFQPGMLIIAVSQISGDGTRHVFTIAYNGELLTDLSGESGNEDSEPSWNSVGTRIVFQSAGRDPAGIWSMNADGSDQAFIPGTENHRNPVWAPNGSRILSISDDNRIFSYLPDGSDVLEVTDSVLFAAWSPDSESIVYWVENPDGGYDLMLIAADGSGEATLVSHSDAEPTGPPFWR